MPVGEVEGARLKVHERILSRMTHIVPKCHKEDGMEERGLQRAAQLARHVCANHGSSNFERLHRLNDPLRPVQWRSCVVGDSEFEEILFEKSVGEGIAKITINRPECHNAFTVKTVEEMERAFKNARDDSDVGVVILTGKGTEAFCSGGDVGVRSREGYVGENRIPRLNVLDLQIQIRRLPKPVIAMVAGYAVGGGHVLQLICDLTIAADNAVFGQTGPKVGSFDAGFGVSAMTHMIGARKTREVWFLTRLYDALEALNMGLCNTVVPLDRLEQETVKWCREILQNSPTSIRVLKAAINATEANSDAQAMAGNSTLIFYATDEAEEGRKAYMEKRKPDFSKFKRLP
ncbi:hypothetical protein R1flu_025233 [Riccia fluitans]|uniref:1,4-dihydroxy-2-naphthoyl-CoA synthase n=1 Tax=Riccia fluitans TaxID=41844 RepID=A0ABD1Y072_9MARC